MKKIIVLMALLGFAFHVTSCKSNKAQDDAELVENADVEQIEAEDAALLSKADTATNVGPVDDSLQAALGETSNQAATDPALATTEPAVTESVSTQPAPPSTDMAAAPTLDEASLNTPAPEVASSNSAAANITTETSMQATPPVAETPVIENSIEPMNVEPQVAAAVSEPTPRSASTETMAATNSDLPVKNSGAGVLKKISETTPYQEGEGWVNTVYIARPKEKLKDISQNIYGMDRTKELKKINSFLAARSPKGGDKIYYVSPNRPADSMKTLSFYEDTGMIAETYVAKKGDNLKKIAKKLLGYEDAYKEVWTTNPVVSKAGLTDGETLRYWKSSSAVIPAVAANTAAPQNTGAQIIESTSQLPSQPVGTPETVAAATPPPTAQTELPAPPPMPETTPAAESNLAQNATPPPPPTELPPPPPPPPTEMAAPPTDPAAAATPPPTEELAAATSKKVVTPNMEEEQTGSGDMNSDTTMMLGGTVVLCALLAYALIRRNKKKKEIEMASMSETNVGT